MPDEVARNWVHPWQVIRWYPDGAIAVVCSHRTEGRADLCAAVQRFLHGHGNHDTDIRRTPRRGDRPARRLTS